MGETGMKRPFLISLNALAMIAIVYYTRFFIHARFATATTGQEAAKLEGRLAEQISKEAVVELLRKLPPEAWSVADIVGEVAGAIELHLNPKIIRDHQSKPDLTKSGLVRQLADNLNDFRRSLENKTQVATQLCVVTININQGTDQEKAPASIICRDSWPLKDTWTQTFDRGLFQDRAPAPTITTYLRVQWTNGTEKSTSDVRVVYIIMEGKQWQIRTHDLSFERPDNQSKWKLLDP
jgi:hypothetical protein